MAYPPTRKKTGITWATQVSGYAQGRSGEGGAAGRPAGAVVPDAVDGPVTENDHDDGERAEQVDDRSRPAGVPAASCRRRRMDPRLCQPGAGRW